MELPGTTIQSPKIWSRRHKGIVSATLAPDFDDLDAHFRQGHSVKVPADQFQSRPTELDFVH